MVQLVGEGVVVVGVEGGWVVGFYVVVVQLFYEIVGVEVMVDVLCCIEFVVWIECQCIFGYYVGSQWDVGGDDQVVGFILVGDFFVGYVEVGWYYYGFDVM